MSWNYTDTEYIKLFRKFTRWEWYTDVNTKVLFLHMLLRANWKASKYRGIALEPGQFIASIEKLAKETGLSPQNVRTALNHLKTTGEIDYISTRKVTRNQLVKGSVFTVKNWDAYQASNMKDNTESNTELTDNQQDTNNRYKNNKEDKEDKNNEPAALSDERTPEEIEIDELYEKLEHMTLTDPRRRDIYIRLGELENDDESNI